MGPRFSVVVPTMGRPRYLEGCLAALARMRAPEGGFEVVVVDDSGGPEVERVVSEAPEAPPIRLTTAGGTGPSAARNTGAAAAAGEYLAFTDDDCEPASDWLVAIARALAAAPEAGVGGRTVNGARQSRGAVASQIVVDALHSQFNRTPGAPRFFASSNLALPAQPFRSIGGFDESFRYGEDREFCERWIETGHRFVHSPEAVVNHMRTLSLSEFVRQHHGYGRGAWAFGRARRAPRHADTSGVLRAMVRETRRADPGTGRLRTAGYVALSQAATASGFLREAASSVVGGERDTHAGESNRD